MGWNGVRSDGMEWGKSLSDYSSLTSSLSLD